MGIKLYYTTVTASRTVWSLSEIPLYQLPQLPNEILDRSRGLLIINHKYDKGFKIKSQQQEVMRILESKSIQYELIDISVGCELRDEMRNKAGNPTAVPPQLFNEDQYCGNYEMFSEAVEEDAVEQFLKLA